MARRPEDMKKKLKLERKRSSEEIYFIISI